jgi:hypothetical protein
MNLATTIELQAYGTSEGACKAVKTKGHQQKKGCGGFSRGIDKGYSREHSSYLGRADLVFKSVALSQLASVEKQKASYLTKSSVDAWKERILSGEALPNLVLASLPNGKLHLLDGNHRLAALQKLGYRGRVGLTVVHPKAGFEWRADDPLGVLLEIVKKPNKK